MKAICGVTPALWVLTYAYGTVRSAPVFAAPLQVVRS